MNRKTVRLGVCGLRRGLVAKKLVKFDGVEICALCDRDEEILKKAVAEIEEEQEKAGKSYAVKAYTSFDELIASDVDAVYIATAATEHVTYVVKAMESGKHVISEVPAINSLEEARRLKECVTSHPELKYMLAENCLYWAFLEMWKQMYRDGMLGEAVYAEGAYLHGMDWMKKRKTSQSKESWRDNYPAIKYLTHSLGPILDIIEDRCVSVSCMIPDVEYNPASSTEKNGIAIFKTEKGTVIRILICFNAYTGYGHRYMIVGTAGSIENDPTKPLEEAYSYASLREVDGSIYRKLEIPVTLMAEGEEETRGRGEIKMLREFISCIQNDTPSPIDVEKAINMSLPGVIAYESAIRGGELMQIPKI